MLRSIRFAILAVVAASALGGTAAAGRMTDSGGIRWRAAAEPTCDAGDAGACAISGSTWSFTVSLAPGHDEVSIGFDLDVGDDPAMSCEGLNDKTQRAGVQLSIMHSHARIRVLSSGDRDEDERLFRYRWACTVIGGTEAGTLSIDSTGRVIGGAGGAGSSTSAGVGGEIHLMAGSSAGGAGGVSAGGTGSMNGWGGSGSTSLAIGHPQWSAGGGSVRIGGGSGSPPGDVHLSIDSIDRVWLDSAGTLHYNGAEVANHADVDAMTENAGIAGLAGAFVGTAFALLGAWLIRRAREAAWNAAQDRSPDGGPYRGTNTHGPL